MNYPNSNDVAALTLVAAEVGATADELASRFGDAVMIDDAGIRCIPTEIACELITAHRAAVQAERERRLREQAERAARPFALRERVRAIAAAEATWDGDPNTPALVKALSRDPDSAQRRSEARLDEMRSGEMVMRRIRGDNR
jgi:hypothetical protein